MKAKRFLSLLLVLLMAAQLCGLAALADEGDGAAEDVEPVVEAPVPEGEFGLELEAPDADDEFGLWVDDQDNEAVETVEEAAARLGQDATGIAAPTADAYGENWLDQLKKAIANPNYAQSVELKTTARLTEDMNISEIPANVMMSGGGSLTIDSDVTLVISGTVSNVELKNNGTLKIASTGKVLNADTLNNGEFTVIEGGEAADVVNHANGTMYVYGEVEDFFGEGGKSTIGSTAVVTGGLNVEFGEVTVASGADIGGNIENGGTLILNTDVTGDIDNIGGTLTVNGKAGDITNSVSGQATINGTVGDITISKGKVTIATGASAGSVKLSGGATEISGTVSRGVASNGGAVTIKAGAKIRVYDDAAVTINKGSIAVNGGTILSAAAAGVYLAAGATGSITGGSITGYTYGVQTGGTTYVTVGGANISATADEGKAISSASELQAASGYDLEAAAESKTMSGAQSTYTLTIKYDNAIAAAPTVTYTEDDETKTAEVKTISTDGTTVTLTYEISSDANNCTLAAGTVTDSDTNEFVGWYIGKKAQSTASSYPLTITSDTTLTATYQAKTGIVTFVSNNATFATWSTESNVTTDTLSTELSAIGNPSPLSGKVFSGWYVGSDTTKVYTSSTAADFVSALKTELGISDESSTATRNVTVTAAFEDEVVNYTIYVYNGEATTAAETKIEKSQQVTFTAETVEGKIFQYWTMWLADSAESTEPFNYNESVTFRPTDSCYLRAVYGTEEPEVLGTAIIQSATLASGTAKFVSYMTLPEGATVKKAGIVVASSNKYNPETNGDLSASNATVKSLTEVEDTVQSTVTYTYTQNNVPSGVTLYARAYLVYVPSGSTTQETIYGTETVTLTAE